MASPSPEQPGTAGPAYSVGGNDPVGLPDGISAEDVLADPRGASREALRRLAALPPGESMPRAQLQEVLVRAYLPLVEHLARRGVRTRPPSDLYRTDFTTDETPNPLLDDLIAQWRS